MREQSNPATGGHPSPAMDTGTPYGKQPPGYRLPDATQLGGVRLAVADLSRSVQYYESVLGLRVLARSERQASLGVEGNPGPLVTLDHERGARPVPQSGRIGLYHFAILLPDRAALGRFLSHLGATGVYAGMSDHLVSEALYLRDPDGLGIEVYADRPRASWTYERGQLQMATKPLDVDDLKRASRGEPWGAMPNGTRLGHVHLHVVDLDRASAFYHEALGLDRVVWSYPGALFLSAGGYHHHLGVNTWAASAPVSEQGDARLLDWEIILPSTNDVTAALSSVGRAGYAVEYRSIGGVIRDPWGTAARIRSGS